MTSSEQGLGQPQSENGRSPLKQLITNENGKLLDQPSRDEIFRRRNSLDLFTAGRAFAEASTTSGLALKFGVRNFAGKITKCLSVVASLRYFFLLCAV